LECFTLYYRENPELLLNGILLDDFLISMMNGEDSPKTLKTITEAFTKDQDNMIAAYYKTSAQNDVVCVNIKRVLENPDIHWVGKKGLNGAKTIFRIPDHLCQEFKK
jgi:hypothetical protein